MATHLRDMSVTLRATRQWWGTTDYERIVPRIFDQFNRYDLARIVYHPALAHDWLYSPVTTDLQIAIEVRRPTSAASLHRHVRLCDDSYACLDLQRNSSYT